MELALQQQPAPSITVCVTGAAGFIASWIVKLLLHRGYLVRATVRDPADAPKVEHLINLEGARDRLVMLKADLLDQKTLIDAIRGSHVVIHTACPCPEANTHRISDPKLELIDPSVNGTLNVLEASRISGTVSTIVMTSSVGAMYLDPKRPRDQPLDESCWSDTEYLAEIGEWYCLAKTLAEKAAWRFAREHDSLKLVVMNPAVIMGPLLQSKLNASSTHILKYLTGSAKSYVNRCQIYADVRDVALAHILAFEDNKSSGRYLVGESAAHRGDLVEILAEMYPEYPIPRVCSDKINPRAVPLKFNNSKLRKLVGSELITLQECLKDSVESLEDKGFIVRVADHGSGASSDDDPRVS